MVGPGRQEAPPVIRGGAEEDMTLGGGNIGAQETKVGAFAALVILGSDVGVIFAARQPFPLSAGPDLGGQGGFAQEAADGLLLKVGVGAVGFASAHDP